jgi:hypothetical protein
MQSIFKTKDGTVVIGQNPSIILSYEEMLEGVLFYKLSTQNY